MTQWTQIQADTLEQHFGALGARAFLPAVLASLPEKPTLVSSFGAEAAVLLKMVADIDPKTPVLLVDTGKLFGETLRYKEMLIQTLGLECVKTVEPDQAAIEHDDPEGMLWSRDPDACCALRKVAPLRKALEGINIWISGRKSFQTPERAGLKHFEVQEGRLKINPLARWTKQELDAFFEEHALPRHPLEMLGYPSIGCMPCTSVVQAGEEARAGRWRGRGKTECGLHTTFTQGQTAKLEIF
jgi:phosphoadenosine phosphosulfate reductase